ATTSPASSSPSTSSRRTPAPSRATPSAPNRTPTPTDPSSMLRLQPLGDQAALASFGREDEALRFSATVRSAAPALLLDVVQAYATVAVFFSPDEIDFYRV